MLSSLEPEQHPPGSAPSPSWRSSVESSHLRALALLVPNASNRLVAGHNTSFFVFCIDATPPLSLARPGFPRISTVDSVGATLDARASTLCQAGEVPDDLLNGRLNSFAEYCRLVGSSSSGRLSNGQNLFQIRGKHLAKLCHHQRFGFRVRFQKKSNHAFNNLDRNISG